MIHSLVMLSSLVMSLKISRHDPPGTGVGFTVTVDVRADVTWLVCSIRIGPDVRFSAITVVAIVDGTKDTGDSWHSWKYRVSQKCTFIIAVGNHSVHVPKFQDKLT